MKGPTPRCESAHTPRRSYDPDVSSASEILERDGELERIADALESAGKGAGRVVVIEGVAGIGKTRLVREARELAQLRGFGRLQATGDESETAMAWGVVRQMVERSVSRYSGEVREAILGGPAGRALQALDVAPDAGASDADIARTLHALWWVAIDLSSTRPLLITVDDAQWADQPSLRFLTYLSRRVSDLPIALVVATRPPADGHGPLAELTVSPHVERMLPGTLSAEAVAAFRTATGEVPCSEVVAAMHAACGGNPFLTGALLDELVTGGHDVTDPATAEAIAGLGPATVSRAMLSRISPEVLEVAAATAVLGLEASPWLAGRVAGVDARQLEDAVSSLVRAHVLVGGVEGLTFVHPVIKEATLAAVEPLQLAALHGRAARELHAQHVAPGQLAPHLMAAPVGTLPDAADLLGRAAAESLAAGDPAAAAAELERALAERPGDTAIRRQLGRALLQAGRAVEAREHLRAVAELAGGARERAELLAEAATATHLHEGPEAGVAELLTTLDGWPARDAEPARLVLEARLAMLRSFVPAQSRAAAEHLLGFAEVAGGTPEERTLLTLLALQGRYRSDPHEQVADHARRALADGALFDDGARGAGLVPWGLALISLVTAGGIETARAELDRARLRVRRAGSPFDFALVSNGDMVLAWRTGDVTATETAAESILSAVRLEPPTSEMVSLRATATRFACYTAMERRDRSAVLGLLEEYDESRQGVEVVPGTWLHEVRARIALADNDPHGAVRLLEALRADLDGSGADPASLAWRLPAAVAYSRTGADDQAAEALAEHLALTRRWGEPSDVGAAIRVAARFETDPEARAERLAEAVAVLEGADDRLERAKALTDQAETWRTLGRRTDARAGLNAAADLAETCGSPALRQRVAAALEAIGDRPRRLVALGAESLTASERRVAGLAVEGRSNRDIAQELFVSPKTVENHLGRVYSKLGIGNRRELAGALA